MNRNIRALAVSQWLPSWEQAEFSEKNYRRRPSSEFFVLSMEATELRRLAGIYRRQIADAVPRKQDLGIQRSHETYRSREIADYVRFGFPWSRLSERKRQSTDFKDLIKPGWLPTAVVVNILMPTDDRLGQTVHRDDIINIVRQGGDIFLSLPDTSEDNWQLSGIPPIEVIDGQHRLWAFDDEVPGYELPVVAFYGLDRSWQAYLFYTINISPKRINASLAYDLYPLLRTEDWLEKFEGHYIYRESRAQELTESLWAHPDSPWHQRINMLGEPGKHMVTQASWVRSLQATFVKSWEGQRVQVGGLFGAPVGENDLVLPWSRAQQAAFLIYAWQELSREIQASDPEWASTLDAEEDSFEIPPALVSRFSMLNSDMGVRGFLYLLNDLCFVRANELGLFEWKDEVGVSATSVEDVSASLVTLHDQSVAAYISILAETLAQYDWRSSKAFDRNSEEHRLKARFRGSGGYRELRRELLLYVAESEHTPLAVAAQEVMEHFGWSDEP